jgi:ATP-dependent protease ClpP protease subunit
MEDSMRWLLAVTVMVIAVVSGAAWAGDVKTATSCSRARTEGICSFDIRMLGEITPIMLDKLKTALVDRDQMMKREGSPSDHWSIDIDSPGGSVLVATEIGRLLRSMQASIEVGPDQVCASACVLVLAGATRRRISGRVGIHRPYFETPNTDVNVGEVQQAYSQMTEQIRSYFREMNVSERLADDMMIVPPEKVRFLSPNELTGYGLDFVDPVTKETSDLREARKLGIDRVEYMRRRAQSGTLCQFVDSIRAGTYLSPACVGAVLSGKHVEKAPPCRNTAAICQPWERDWNGRKLDARDVVTGDGFLISRGS